MEGQGISGTNGAQRGAFSSQQMRGPSSPQVRRSEVSMARAEVSPAIVISVLRSPVNQPLMAHSVPVSRAPVLFEARDDGSRLQRARRSLQSVPRMSPSKSDPVATSRGNFSDVDSEVAVSRRLFRRSPINETSRHSIESSSRHGHAQLV